MTYQLKYKHLKGKPSLKLSDNSNTSLKPYLSNKLLTLCINWQNLTLNNTKL